MRVIVFVKATEDSEKGVFPSTELFAARISRFVDFIECHRHDPRPFALHSGRQIGMDDRVVPIYSTCAHTGEYRDELIACWRSSGRIKP